MKRLILIILVISFSVGGYAQAVTKIKTEGSGEKKVKKEVVTSPNAITSTTAHHAYATHHGKRSGVTSRNHHSTTYKKHHITHKKHHSRKHHNHNKKVKKSYKNGKSKVKYES
jgi:hypothetical protein